MHLVLPPHTSPDSHHRSAPWTWCINWGHRNVRNRVFHNTPIDMTAPQDAARVLEERDACADWRIDAILREPCFAHAGQFSITGFHTA